MYYLIYINEKYVFVKCKMYYKFKMYYSASKQ